MDIMEEALERHPGFQIFVKLFEEQFARKPVQANLRLLSSWIVSEAVQRQEEEEGRKAKKKSSSSSPAEEEEEEEEGKKKKRKRRTTPAVGVRTVFNFKRGALWRHLHSIRDPKDMSRANLVKAHTEQRNQLAVFASELNRLRRTVSGQRSAWENVVRRIAELQDIEGIEALRGEMAAIGPVEG